jgi:NADPH-dependent ferric siderophore reductase
VADLIRSIGTFLTFSGTVTESTWLPGYQRGLSNRRLQVEDHGVRVKAIVGSGWASDVREGDQLTLRGPIKGYEIWADGLSIVLAKTRPILDAAARPGDPPQLPAWPPVATAGARRRLRSQRAALLRPHHTSHRPTSAGDSDAQA